MYSDGFLNAGGKTPQQIDAEKKAAAKKKAEEEELKKTDPAAYNLMVVTRECNAAPVSSYCRGIGKATILCTNRIKGCISSRMKEQKKASELEIDKSSDKVQDELMKKINSGEDDAMRSVGGAGDDVDDNTILYVVGGVGVVAILGVVGYFFWKKNQSVAV